jgi:hypothetical protein
MASLNQPQSEPFQINQANSATARIAVFPSQEPKPDRVRRRKKKKTNEGKKNPL